MNIASKFTVHLFALGLLMLCCAPAVLAEGFPGKGDQDAWSDALPYYNQGNSYLNQERFGEAATRFEEAIAKYEFDPDFFVNLGIARRKLGEYDKAEAAFKKAISLNSKDYVAWGDLAAVYVKQDKLKEAVTTFQTELKCNPPPAEKAAILQDIKDINKILSMSRTPEAAEAKAKAAAAKSTTTKSTKASPEKKTSQEEEKSLKGSGWDYVYNGK